MHKNIFFSETVCTVSTFLVCNNQTCIFLWFLDPIICSSLTFVHFMTGTSKALTERRGDEAPSVKAAETSTTKSD